MVGSDGTVDKGKTPCWAAAGKWAVVWILGIPRPQRQDVCTGHDALNTDAGAGGVGGGEIPSLAASCPGCVPTIVSQGNLSSPRGVFLKVISDFYYAVAPVCFLSLISNTNHQPKLRGIQQIHFPA